MAAAVAAANTALLNQWPDNESPASNELDDGETIHPARCEGEAERPAPTITSTQLSAPTHNCKILLGFWSNYYPTF